MFRNDGILRYSAGLRRLHWVMFALIAAAYFCIEQRGLFERGSTGRAAMMQAHFWLGLSVLALGLWRLALRLRRGAPPIRPPLPRWQALPATTVHALFYGVLFVAMPLLGLATAWTAGRAIEIPFTDLALPQLLATDKALSHRIEDIHHWIGKAFYAVIALHAAMALAHHWIRKDDTLRRML